MPIISAILLHAGVHDDHRMRFHPLVAAVVSPVHLRYPVKSYLPRWAKVWKGMRMEWRSLVIRWRTEWCQEAYEWVHGGDAW